MKYNITRTWLAMILVPAGMLAAGCGASSKSSHPGATTPPPSVSTGGTARVLPVTSNPIANSSTVQALKIASVLVENNVDPAGRPVSDHLEIALENKGSSALTGFEVFYTVTDPAMKLSESYYTKLPKTFVIAPGAKRTIHFDNTGAPDHFPVNSYGLYATSKNTLDIKVMVSAAGSAPQTTAVHKAAGGAENANK